MFVSRDGAPSLGTRVRRLAGRGCGRGLSKAVPGTLFSSQDTPFPNFQPQRCKRLSAPAILSFKSTTQNAACQPPCAAPNLRHAR